MVRPSPYEKLQLPMDYHYVCNGEQAGPVPAAEVLRLEREGGLNSATLVWRPGMAGWQTVAQTRAELVAEAGGSVGSISPQDGTTYCPHCGRRVAGESLILVAGKPTCCASCKDEYIQRQVEGVPLQGGFQRFEYAGFWIRFVAKVIDGLLLSVVSMVFMAIFGGVMAGVGAGMQDNPEAATGLMIGLFVLIYGGMFAVAIGYNVLFLGNARFQATPGKMAVGLRVIRADGGRVSYGRATGRFFAEWISQMVLYIGYIIAGFDEEKRALHDHICGTRVIFKR